MGNDVGSGCSPWEEWRSSPTSDQVDIVVVGSGSAGSVLAIRLSADPDLILGNTPLPPDRPQRPPASEEPGQRVQR